MTDLLASLLVLAIHYALYVIEAVAVLLALRTALRSPRLVNRFFRRAEHALARLARRKTLAVALAGLLPVAVRLAMLGFLPPDFPHIPDNTAYVLAGETYARGRLTNPPHPLWVHFETIHVNQQPTYASMYFPAQGLFLAAGKVLAGHLWAGVVISVGLMCGALCWMLQGWFPPAWALLGALLAVIRLGIFGYWMNSYYGGAIPALGGALVLGAAPRLMRNRRLRDSVLLAAGLVMLAYSRPFEGMILALPVGVFLLGWLLGNKRPPRRVIALRIAMPVLLILAAAAGWIGYYNWRVTGHALRTPYQVNRSTYVQARYFLWERQAPPVKYRHQPLHDFYVGKQLEHDLRSRSPLGLAKTYAAGLAGFWLFYLGPALSVPLAALPWVLKNRRMRFLLLAGGFSALGLAANIWFYPHYAAPMTAILYAVLVQGIRRVRLWRRRDRPAGMFLARAIPAVCLLMLAVRLAAQPFSRFAPPDFPPTWYSVRPERTGRAAILAQLHSIPGKHLVIVRYGPNHNCFQEWVTNEPEIDLARVVWAREMDESRNRKLLSYFHDRHVWLLEPDLEPPRLSRDPRQARLP